MKSSHRGLLIFPAVCLACPCCCVTILATTCFPSLSNLQAELRQFCLQKSFNTGLNMLYCNHISRMWSWECFLPFHKEVCNQEPGILSVRFPLLRIFQRTRNLVWCSSERRHLNDQIIVFQEAAKNPQQPHWNPLALCLGVKRVFISNRPVKPKSLETSIGKLMYNFCKKVKDLLSSEDWI